jgi:hypothetical protein
MVASDASRLTELPRVVTTSTVPPVIAVTIGDGYAPDRIATELASVSKRSWDEPCIGTPSLSLVICR